MTARDPAGLVIILLAFLSLTAPRVIRVRTIEARDYALKRPF